MDAQQHDEIVNNGRRHLGGVVGLAEVDEGVNELESGPVAACASGAVLSIASGSRVVAPAAHR